MRSAACTNLGSKPAFEGFRSSTHGKRVKLDRFCHTFGIDDRRISEPLKGKQFRTINMVGREGSV